MKTGIIRLASSLHNNDIIKENNSFLQAIFQTYEEVLIEEYKQYDFIFFFIETGGTENKFKEIYKQIEGPFYLITTGKNNSLAASMEILSFLKNNDEEAEIFHGSIEYIKEKVLSTVKIKQAIDLLGSSHLGVIGQPSDWLISSSVDYDEAFDVLGIKITDIPMTNLLDEISKKKIPATSIVNEIVLKKYNEKETIKALEVYGALKEIVKSYNLTGLTIRCFDLLDSVKTTGCIALALLNKEGITATCEGDLKTMISMEIIRCLTNEPSFQVNPARIDIDNNEVVFAHCTIPLNMTTSYELDTHFESGIGVAVKGILKEEDVTIFKVSDDFETYFVSEGRIINNLFEDDLCRTQIKIKLDKDVNYFLTNPIGNHHIIIKGKHEKLINQFFKILLNK